MIPNDPKTLFFSTKKKRIISKNGFEKINPASWATFSPKSLKIVANARRPLRGRNGILKITLRWVSTTVKIHAKGENAYPGQSEFISSVYLPLA